jgi:LuxR family maltose regulon positive regulatory protein
VVERARRPPVRALPAKLSRPQARSLLPRERIFRAIDAPASGRCVWIGAPAGAGKTSVASGWVESRELDCLWYQLDAGDADPATLFYYLGLAAQRMTRGRALHVPPLTPEFLPGLDVYARRFFEKVFSLYPSSFALVLDNCHEVAADSPFFGVVLPALLESLPERGKLLCLSRDSLAPGLTRWSAEPGFGQLSMDDLGFSDAEAVELTRLVQAGAAGSAAALNQLSRGWIAGLKLLLRASPEDISLLRSGPRPMPQSLFDYLAAEVFDRAPRETREFLMRCALLPQMSARTMAALTQSTDAEAMLARLYAERLFIEKRALPEGTSYQFHPLFRDFLLARAAREIPPHERLELKTQAASLLERAGEFESAAVLAIEARDWGLLRRVVLGQALAFFSQGRAATLETWLTALPGTELATDGWLLYWRGRARFYRDPQLAREDLQQAFARFRASDDMSGAFLAAAGIIESRFVTFAWGAPPVDQHWLVEFEGLLAQTGGVIPREIQGQVVATFGHFVSYAPDHRLSRQLVARAQTLVTQAAETDEPYASGVVALAYLVWQGDQVAAWRVIDELLRRPSPGTSGFNRILTAIWHGILLWTASEHERAQAVLQAALEEVRSSGLRIGEAIVVGQIAMTALSAGDFEAAGQALHQCERAILPFQSGFQRFVQGIKVAQLALSGQTVLAAAMARELAAAPVDPAAPAPPTMCAQEQCYLGIGFLEAGLLDQAAACLRAAVDYAGRMPSERWMFEALLLQAGVALERNDVAGALAPLREALRIGRFRGFTGGVGLFQARRTARLFSLALREEIDPPYVRQLILKRRLNAPAENEISDRWPWRLHLRTLGRFAVRIDDQPLAQGGRAQRKPMEVLKALAALGPQEASLISLSTLLWPDLEGDAAHNACHVAIHRLRRLVGDESVIAVEQGKISLAAGAWVDAFAFRRTADRIDSDLAAGRLTDAALADCARTLLAAYPGHFLPEEDGAWAIGAREQLRSRFVRLALALGSALERREAAEPAIDLNRRGIELDPLVEAFHRGLMQGLAALGRKAEALQVYGRCRDLLAASLGVEPSIETQRLRERLQQV